jgi:hypothetical protein
VVEVTVSHIFHLQRRRKNVLITHTLMQPKSGPA